ncbi:MAG: hypothetical protein JXA41_05620, partial [Deltaproteobacteria bacterium]|nr:hypothetical protein [Deltaproteobacteria bacterium]
MKKIYDGNVLRLVIKAIKRALGGNSPDRFGIRTTSDAIDVLVDQVVKLVSAGTKKGVLLVTDLDSISDQIASILLKKRLAVQKISIQEIDQLPGSHLQNISCVVAGFLVLSRFLCKMFIGKFFKERQILTHFSY